MLNKCSGFNINISLNIYRQSTTTAHVIYLRTQFSKKTFMAYAINITRLILTKTNTTLSLSSNVTSQNVAAHCNTELIEEAIFIGEAI